MGLDTTHNAWHGPYSSFMQWRIEIAKHIGIPDLSQMEYFGGDISWKGFGNHNLYYLLTHSDCQGVLSPKTCKRIADGLTEILPKIQNEYFKQKTEQFITGCLLAYEQNEKLEFH